MLDNDKADPTFGQDPWNMTCLFLAQTLAPGVWVAHYEGLPPSIQCKPSIQRSASSGKCIPTERQMGVRRSSDASPRMAAGLLR